MSIEPRKDPVRGIIRTAMIIHGALILGLLSFLTIALVLNQQSGPLRPDGAQQALITYVAAAAGAMILFVAMVLPPLLDAAARKTLAAMKDSRSPEGRSPTGGSREPSAMPHSSGGGQGARWAARGGESGPPGHEVFLARAYLTKTLILGALLEGAALFCGVAFLMEGRPLAIAAMGVLVLAMAMMFPTEDHAGRWMERQGRVSYS